MSGVPQAPTPKCSPSPGRIHGEAKDDRKQAHTNHSGRCLSARGPRHPARPGPSGPRRARPQARQGFPHGRGARLSRHRARDDRRRDRRGLGLPLVQARPPGGPRRRRPGRGHLAEMALRAEGPGRRARPDEHRDDPREGVGPPVPGREARLHLHARRPAMERGPALVPAHRLCRAQTRRPPAHHRDRDRRRRPRERRRRRRLLPDPRGIPGALQAGGPRACFGREEAGLEGADLRTEENLVDTGGSEGLPFVEVVFRVSLMGDHMLV